jgi:hypothetical protein
MGPVVHSHPVDTVYDLRLPVVVARRTMDPVEEGMDLVEENADVQVVGHDFDFYDHHTILEVGHDFDSYDHHATIPEVGHDFDPYYHHQMDHDSEDEAIVVVVPLI